ncbi:MAG: hypothetical protein ABEN55_14585, partial [Bradymonadaceae bacterium]
MSVLVTCLCWIPPSTGAVAQETDDGDIDDQLDALEKEVDRKTREADNSSDNEDGKNGDEDDSSSVDTQIDEIEAEIGGESGDGDGNDGQQSLNPDLSAILDAGFAWQANEPTLVGGPDPKSFGPFLQSVELALRADVDPFFTFETHLVASLSGLKIGEVYGTTLALPAGLQVRFGKFKTAFGRVNPLHLHAWHFTALPLVNGKFFGPAGLNGIGTEVSQLLPLPWYVEWTVAIQALSGPPTGRAFLRDPAGLEGPLDLVATGRLEQFFELSNDLDLMWGLNAALGRNDSGGLSRRDEFRTGIYGTDLFFKLNPAEQGGRSRIGWQTEAMVRNRQTPGGTLTDLGGYSYLYWAPTRDWEFGTRYEYVTGPLEAEGDYLHPDWREARQRAGLAVSFFPSNFSRFRLEYMTGDFEAGLDQLDHTVLLQAQLVAGAHG